MALKGFKELYSLDLKQYVQKKPTFKRNQNGKLVKTDQKYWLDYIEWSMVIFLLYENGAEKVKYGSEWSDKNYPVFYDHNGNNPFVKIWVEIDGEKYIYDYPVIDGNKVEQSPNQLVIHKSQQRGFVKCVAVHTGLGLKLWQKEEKNFDEIGSVENENKDNKPELKPDMKEWPGVIKALNNGYTIADVRKKYFMTEENENKLLDESI